ncbi:MAG TPA: AAA family ATPase, partial [Chlamydiales bacterium]|nr:AAA family ATPase [Chlamydiales bacterium]
VVCLICMQEFIVVTKDLFGPFWRMPNAAMDPTIVNKSTFTVSLGMLSFILLKVATNRKQFSLVAEWRHAFSRLKRPISSIILDPEIKQKILDDCRDFMENEEWYADRGIPYRRGYLLHGVPGSGKTSLIHSIAGELDLDIYMVSLSKKGLDDADFLELITQLPARCIAVIEDIDVAFKGEKRSNVAGTVNEEPEENGEKTQKPESGGSESSTGVTLSGLLNALDGLVAQEGRLLFATTNCMEALDEALCRPGRMDVHVEFKNASRSQARQLFRCFFPPTPSESDKVANSNVPHFRSVPLTPHEASSLAEKFSDAIPEGVFSVATLQGFLLNYKDKPCVAVEVAPEWVKGEMEKRSAKLKAEAEEKEREKTKVEAERTSRVESKRGVNGKKRRGRGR